MSSTQIQPTNRGTNPKRLTDKQRVFVEAYLADNEMNAAAAARAAGYSGSAAGGKLLANPLVARAIGKAIQERMSAHRIEASRVLRELACLGFADVRQLFDSEGLLREVQDLPEEIARAVSSIEVSTRTNEDGEVVSSVAKIKLHPKIPALELIARHLGMLDERLKVEHGVGGDVINALLEKVENNGRGVVDSSFIEAQAEPAEET